MCEMCNDIIFITGETFIDLALECLETNPDINLPDLTHALSDPLLNTINIAIFNDLKPTTNLQSDNLLSTFFDIHHGFCQLFDLKQIKEYEYLTPYSTFHIAFYSTKKLTAFIHEPHEFPAEIDTVVGLSSQTGFKIKKGKTSKVSLNRAPCSEKNSLACSMDTMKEEIKMMYKCKIPWFEQEWNENITECSNKHTFSGIKKLLELKTKSCNTNSLCHQTKYSIEMDPSFPRLYLEKYNNSFMPNSFALSYSNHIVENINITPSYNFQSLIGEVGGTLGLFLGLSLLGILEYLPLKPKWKKFVIGFGIFISCTGFIYWAVQSLIKFLDEPVSTQVRFSKGTLKSDFPLLAFCAKGQKDGDNNFFLDKLKTNLQNKSFDIVEFIENEHYNANEAFKQPHFTTLNHEVMLDDSKIWRAVYHRLYGLCHTLDVKKELTVPNLEGPIIFKVNISKTKNSPLVLLHETKEIDNHAPILEFRYIFSTI